MPALADPERVSWSPAWPLLAETTRHELSLYLATAGKPAHHDEPTRCRPWRVRDVTRHLACTFRRFADLLEQGRRGDLTPPFAPEQLAKVNLRAVEAFEGVPEEVLSVQVQRFLDLVGDPGEPVPHQFGPLPAAVQVAFGVAELAIHHDDVAAALGQRHEPDPAVAESLLAVWTVWKGAPPAGASAWERLLASSGR